MHSRVDPKPLILGALAGVAVIFALIGGFDLGSDPATPTKSSTKANPASFETIKSWQASANQKKKTGDYPGALADYLRCFDEGSYNARFSSIRRSFLLSGIADLGKEFPLAFDELRKRRDASAAKILANRDLLEAARDFQAINWTLKETRNTLALYDDLPPTDKRRLQLRPIFFEDFIIEARYTDAAATRSPESMLAQFTTAASQINLTETEGSTQARLKRGLLIAHAARNLEVLLGIGDETRAHALARYILQFDNSPDTRQLLLKHASIAGKAEFAL